MPKNSQSFSYNVLNAFLIFLCLTSFHFPTSNAEVSKNYSSTLNQDTSFDATQFIEEIINTLINEAQYENESLLGWIHEFNSKHQPDKLFYSGYQVGVAGIGDFLIDAYTAGFDNLTSILD
ncbi:hypothetical protein LCGC14_2296420, partial [marine sediment metagenome]